MLDDSDQTRWKSFRQISGEVLPYGVDSQIIRPDGFTELVARYAIKLDDGNTIYINNAGVRRISDPEAAKMAAQGEIVDRKFVYFATIPTFEVYDAKYKWMEKIDLLCYAMRLPDTCYSVFTKSNNPKEVFMSKRFNEHQTLLFCFYVF